MQEPTPDPYEDVDAEVGEIIRSFEKVAVGHVSFARAARMAEAVLAMEAPGDVEAITEAIRVADGARTAITSYRELAVLIHQHQTDTVPPPTTDEVLAGAKPVNKGGQNILPTPVPPLKQAAT